MSVLFLFTYYNARKVTLQNKKLTNRLWLAEQGLKLLSLLTCLMFYLFIFYYYYNVFF